MANEVISQKERERNEKYEALARYISHYDTENLPENRKLLYFPVEDKDFLLEACLDKVPETIKENGDILYCPKCERQARKNYDKYCSGCGKKLLYVNE